MLTQATIENLTPEDLAILSSEDLTQPEVAQHLEQMVNDAEFDYEAGEARDFLDALNALLATHQEELKNNQELYTQYMTLLWNLRWKAMFALDPQAQENLLSDNLIFSLQKGFDVKTWVGKMVEVTEFGTYPDSKTRQRLLTALGRNQERISTQNITVEGQVNATPTVQNWLKDFEAFLLQTGNRTLAQKEYLGKNKNAQALSREDKQVLQKILDLFIWLKYPQITGEFISVQEAEQQLKARRPGRAQQTPVATPAEPRIAAPQETIPPSTPTEQEQPVERVTDVQRGEGPPTFRDTITPTPQQGSKPAQSPEDLDSVEKRLAEGGQSTREEKRVSDTDKQQTTDDEQQEGYRAQDPYREPIE